MDAIPVFDFANPWVAIIQIVLFYLLPRIVGLVSDGSASTLAKGLLLGALSVLASALTFLLDVAVASTWATLDWTAFINVVVNAAITWVIAQQLFDRVIKPSGQAAFDSAHGVSLLPASSLVLTASEAGESSKE
jgi:hypothetical protein